MFATHGMAGCNLETRHRIILGFNDHNKKHKQTDEGHEGRNELKVRNERRYKNYPKFLGIK